MAKIQAESRLCLGYGLIKVSRSLEALGLIHSRLDFVPDNSGSDHLLESH